MIHEGRQKKKTTKTTTHMHAHPRTIFCCCSVCAVPIYFPFPIVLFPPPTEVPKHQIWILRTVSWTYTRGGEGGRKMGAFALDLQTTVVGGGLTRGQKEFHPPQNPLQLGFLDQENWTVIPSPLSPTKNKKATPKKRVVHNSTWWNFARIIFNQFQEKKNCFG